MPVFIIKSDCNGKELPKRGSGRRSTMGRKQKHPEHKERAEALMNTLLDEVASLWTAEDEPELLPAVPELPVPAVLRQLWPVLVQPVLV